jgi:hypothetical protein
MLNQPARVGDDNNWVSYAERFGVLLVFVVLPRVCTLRFELPRSAAIVRIGGTPADAAAKGLIETTSSARIGTSGVLADFSIPLPIPELIFPVA